MRITRLAERDDFPQLLALYRQLNPRMPALPDDAAASIWDEMLNSPRVGLFVSSVGGELVATCLLATAPNLMRGGASHAILENVVTHRDHRRQGHGRATIEAALADAWQRLPSGGPDHRTPTRRSPCADVLLGLRFRDRSQDRCDRIAAAARRSDPTRR